MALYYQVIFSLRSKASLFLLILFCFPLQVIAQQLQVSESASTPNVHGKLADIRGRINIKLLDIGFENLGPMIVYLEPVEESPIIELTPMSHSMSQKNARFEPPFMVIGAGDTLHIPNDDTIIHNAFSYSRNNEFELGLYSQGKSRKVVLNKPGVVNIYCSIHKSMNATVFVTPTRYWAEVDKDKNFTIKMVPHGRYILKSYNKIVPSASLELNVLKSTTDAVLSVQ